MKTYVLPCGEPSLLTPKLSWRSKEPKETDPTTSDLELQLMKNLLDLFHNSHVDRIPTVPDVSLC